MNSSADNLKRAVTLGSYTVYIAGIIAGISFAFLVILFPVAKDPVTVVKIVSFLSGAVALIAIPFACARFLCDHYIFPPGIYRERPEDRDSTTYESESMNWDTGSGNLIEWEKDEEE